MLKKKLTVRPTRARVLIGGICALILTMGIARYAFTPMIPLMQEQSPLMTESRAGWLAGWAYIGYLTGLFIVWLVNDLKLKDYLYRYGLLLAIGATIVMALMEHVLVWYASRFFAGIATAFGFMFGTGLVVKYVIFKEEREDIGIHFSGVGLGIVVGAVIVALTAPDGMFPLNWHGQWLALAAVGAVLFIPAFALFPFPHDDQIAAAAVEGRAHEPSEMWLWLLQIAYICAGFSNTVNITFTSLMTEYQPLEGQGTMMWLYVGLAAAPAPFIWDRIKRRIGALDALRAAFVVHIASNILMANYQSYTATLLSSITFGFAFMGIVSLTLSLVGMHYRYRATQVMARLTLSYCIAQILSPILAGHLVEATGSFAWPLYAVSGIMIFGLITLLAMKKYPLQN